MDSPPKPRKLLDQLRDVLWVTHYSYRTEQAYVAWGRLLLRQAPSGMLFLLRRRQVV